MQVTSDIGVPPHKQRHEGRVTTEIEERTSRLPSTAYLGLAVGSIVASALFQLAGKRHLAIFVGQWVPSLLVIGVYNKLVKIEHEILEAVDSSPEARSHYPSGV